MLEVQNITKLYDLKIKGKSVEKVGIQGISFKAEGGKIFGLIGANGAGKTTTMRIISGLINAQDGNLKWDHEDYSHIKNLKNIVSLVSNDTQVYDRLTPREILKLFGKINGLSETDINLKTKEVSDKLDMSEFIDTICLNFSTGMKQKTSIARALITDPELLIFDEVTSGLDIFASQAVKDIILNLKENKRTIIYSTHILSDVDELCDDIAVIHKGKLLITGNLQELLKTFQSKNTKDLFFKILKEHE